MKRKRDTFLTVLVGISIVSVILGLVLAIYKGNPDIKNNTEMVEGYDDSNFKLDSDNKYIIHDDTSILSMENDGGSHTDVYYEIDLNKNNVSKISERYQVKTSEKNGKAIQTRKRTKKLEYTKGIDYSLSEYILKDYLKRLDKINDNGRQDIGYLLVDKDVETYIYNENALKRLKALLNYFDNMSDSPFKLDSSNKYVVHKVDDTKEDTKYPYYEIDLASKTMYVINDTTDFKDITKSTIDDDIAKELQQLFSDINSEKECSDENDCMKYGYHYFVENSNFAKNVDDVREVNRIEMLLNI